MKLRHLPALLSKISLCLTLPVLPGFAQTVLTNDAAYNQDLPKSFVVEYSGNEPTAWRIVDASTQAVALQGDFSEVGQPVTDWSQTQKFQRVDFSELTATGSYYAEVDVNGSVIKSPAFTLSKNALLDATIPQLMNFFKQSRADESTVWTKDAAVRKTGGGLTTYDVRGGWYDASGDISKYLSHLSYANYFNPQQIPMTAWVLADVAEKIPTYLGAVGQLDAVKEEAIWGADYLLRVLDQEGYFYITIFDGWNGQMSSRTICAFEGSDGVKTSEYQAAFREGGGVSIAALARISTWGIYGDSTSAQYLAGAEKGFAHLVATNGTYGDTPGDNFLDVYTSLLAATELYAATQKSEYIEYARARQYQMGALFQAEQGYFWADLAKTRPYYHAAEAGLPLVVLSRYLEVETDAEQRAMALNTLKENLDYQVEVSSETYNPFGYARQTVNYNTTIQNNFFIPRTNETGYWWQGESARQASISAGIAKAGRWIYGKSLPKAYKALAVDQIDWILGKNPYNVSMFSGIGENNPPVYNKDSKMPIHGHLDGGISNGITSANNNGTGISWNPPEVLAQGWENWRWVEQWLPHSTWFLAAVASWYEFDEVVPTQNIQTFNPKQMGNKWYPGLAEGQIVEVFNSKGQKVYDWTSQGRKSYLDFGGKQGIYILRSSQGSSKILVR